VSNQKSNVRGRWDRNEMELAGSPDGLRKLAGQLREATEGLPITLAELDDEMIKPYVGALCQIVVQREPGTKVRLTRLGEVLYLSGDVHYLEILADALEFPDDTPPTPLGNYHVHIEYFPDHFYLAPDSEPVVVVGEIQG
jgi:hypothetical protein